MRDNCRAGGYTLVEVACAFAVLGTMATALYSGETGSTRGVARSFQETSALHLASSHLDRLASSGEAPVPGTWKWDIDDRASGALLHVRGYRTTVVREDGMFEVTAEVSWVDPRHLRRERVALTTLIAPKEQR